MAGKMIREGKEKYANKAMMKQHERAETPAKERMEGMKKGGKVATKKKAAPKKYMCGGKVKKK